MKIRKTTIFLLLVLFLTFGTASGWNVWMSGSVGTGGWVDDFTDTPGTRLDAHTPTGTPEMGSSSIISATGTIQDNRARHTEVLGEEKVTNGINFTGGPPPTGWLQYNAIVTNDGSDRLSVADDGDYTSAYQELTLVLGDIYIFEVQTVSITGGNFSIAYGETSPAGGVGTDNRIFYSPSIGSHTFYFKATATTMYITFGTDSGWAGVFDNISVKPLVLASTLTLSRLGFQQSRVWFTPYASAGELSGVILHGNDSVASTDGLWAYIDRTSGNLVVFKRVAGTDTTLIDESFTYSEGAKGLVVYDSGKIWVFYNELLVGDPTAYTPAPGHTYTGFWSTGSGSVDDFSSEPLGYEEALATSGDDITKANPGVVTITSHGLSDGDLVYFSGLTQMTEMNAQYDMVTNKNVNDFEIRDTSGYGNAETTGGAVCQKVN